MKRFNPDIRGERLTRKLAGHTSRRGLLSRLGLALAAAPVFPVLPVSRAQAQEKRDRGAAARTHFFMNAQTKDDTKCDYWRYCGVDGNLCSCCGGGARIPEITKLAERVFQLPVSLGKANSISGIKSALDQPEFATAIGLVKFGSFQQKKRNTKIFGEGLKKTIGDIFNRRK